MRVENNLQVKNAFIGFFCIYTCFVMLYKLSQNSFMLTKKKILFLVEKIQQALDNINWSQQSNESIAVFFHVPVNTIKHARKNKNKQFNLSALYILFSYFQGKETTFEYPNRGWICRLEWKDFKKAYIRYYKHKEAVELAKKRLKFFFRGIRL